MLNVEFYVLNQNRQKKHQHDVFSVSFDLKHKKLTLLNSCYEHVFKSESRVPIAILKRQIKGTHMNCKYVYENSGS